MAYQRKPEDILWATLSDGTLISMTYDPEQDVVAWARHPLPTGDTSQVVSEATTVFEGTYTMTYFSENGEIWGVPLYNRTALSLDAGGRARNIGGITVGIPCTGHPFAVGEVIRIEGSSKYEGDFTLTAGTTANELQFAATYNAEIFDGTETIVKNIGGLNASGGRMVQDSNNNLYFGHNWDADNNTYVTKIAPDGTKTYDFLNHSWTSGRQTVLGMAISADDRYLWIYFDGGNYLEKWDLTTGEQDWVVMAGVGGGYDLDIDADNNAYTVGYASGPYGIGRKLAKFEPTAGAKTNMGVCGNYAVVVDDALGIVVGGYRESYPSDPGLTNLAVATLDGSATDKIALGGTYQDGSWYSYTVAYGFIATDGQYIYALCYTPTATLYKVSWDGSSLAVVASTSAPTYACRIYFDLYGNLVLVNQSAISYQSEIFYFYDTDLNLLGSIDNWYNSMLNDWSADNVGGNYKRGDAVFDGTLETSTIPAVTEESLNLGANSVAVIPGTNEDEVWVSVGRAVNDTVVRYIERLKPFNWGTDMEDMFFVDSGLTYDSVPTTSVTGLSHLEGETVTVLGDGAVLPSQVVSGGSITLTESVSVAQVGLPYTYKLKPMRMDQNTRRGTSKGSIKKFAEVVISFFKTLNARYGDGTDYYDIEWRETSAEYSTPPDLVTGDKVVVADGGFDAEDPIEITGNSPMPCSVRAMVPRVEVTGR
jgi:hypothetical protein